VLPVVVGARVIVNVCMASMVCMLTLFAG
jgi:hypothetical protein